MQGFIQAVLLMSIFERRLSFQMLYFMKNDHKITPQKGEGLEALQAVRQAHCGTLVEDKGVKPLTFLCQESK